MAKLAYNFARVAWLQAGSRSPEPSDFHKAGVSDIDHGERNTANLNGSTPRAKPKARAARNSVFRSSSCSKPACSWSATVGEPERTLPYP